MEYRWKWGSLGRKFNNLFHSLRKLELEGAPGLALRSRSPQGDQEAGMSENIIVLVILGSVQQELDFV